jgi:hypothetical protein
VVVVHKSAFLSQGNNIGKVYTGHKISASLSYVTVRGVGRWKGQGGAKTPYALWLPLPPRTSTGWPPTCVFVTVNEARIYLAISIGLLFGAHEHSKGALYARSRAMTSAAATKGITYSCGIQGHCCNNVIQFIVTMYSRSVF